MMALESCVMPETFKLLHSCELRAANSKKGKTLLFWAQMREVWALSFIHTGLPQQRPSSQNQSESHWDSFGRGSRLWSSLHFAFNKPVFRPCVSIGLQDVCNEEWSHCNASCCGSAWWWWTISAQSFCLLSTERLHKNIVSAYGEQTYTRRKAHQEINQIIWKNILKR